MFWVHSVPGVLGSGIPGSGVFGSWWLCSCSGRFVFVLMFSVIGADRNRPAAH